ncbi:hypothetical protein DIU31_022245 [Mucilaginibacter rubeus]|uniref:Uncharacterized protein n=1 Tax=Mucilaginibacter rubeus TaxID=2027860 RepID=A0AAE6JI32_9SPHI|nr:hypothetical protein [Mucilaginibacter gossypii]QEM06099.1 hypothetical protein DIU31_022245 [Mucilaginibacter rubeus]QEM18679.1 hypothetical protein DIU38_022470 [Mucilaginibacter gossypii]RAV60088.1 hypothetical protein DIU36_01980 [Mucilaginibacter rubeus]
MKNRVFSFFLLLAGIIYLSSVLEFDHEESKANFKQEQQFKIAIEKPNDVQVLVHLALLPLLFAFSIISLHYCTETNPKKIFNLSRFLPPERLFLQYSVFRI